MRASVAGTGSRRASCCSFSAPWSCRSRTPLRPGPRRERCSPTGRRRRRRRLPGGQQSISLSRQLEHGVLPDYLGGKARATDTADAKASLTVQGRCRLVGRPESARRAARPGSVRRWRADQDGQHLERVVPADARAVPEDLGLGRVSTRITIEARGTDGRPTVSVDAFVVRARSWTDAERPVACTRRTDPGRLPLPRSPTQPRSRLRSRPPSRRRHRRLRHPTAAPRPTPVPTLAPDPVARRHGLADATPTAAPTAAPTPAPTATPSPAPPPRRRPPRRRAEPSG